MKTLEKKFCLLLLLLWIVLCKVLVILKGEVLGFIFKEFIV